MSNRVYVGYFIRENGDIAHYHLSRDGFSSLCGLSPSPSLSFTRGDWSIERALSHDHVRDRGCKTCVRMGNALRDAITRLGDTVRDEGVEPSCGSSDLQCR